MRLIDADAMREDWLENGENEYVYDTNAILESIDEQPTIESAERDKIIDELVNKVMHEFTVLEHHDRYPTVTDCKIILRDVAEEMKGGAE